MNAIDDVRIVVHGLSGGSIVAAHVISLATELDEHWWSEWVKQMQDAGNAPDTLTRIVAERLKATVQQVLTAGPGAIVDKALDPYERGRLVLEGLFANRFELAKLAEPLQRMILDGVVKFHDDAKALIVKDWETACHDHMTARPAADGTEPPAS